MLRCSLRNTSGVPQGSVIGPLLFLLYINDIGDVNLDGVVFKLFADDVKLYCKVDNDANVVSDLSSALANIKEWADLWQLSISVEKCAVLAVGKNNPKREYHVDGEVLEKVTSFRDLGICMTSTLSMSQHSSNIANKAKCRMGVMFRAFASKNPKILCRAYTTYIRPLLENCTSVWSPHMVKDVACIEHVQEHFTRRVFKRCNWQILDYKERCVKLNIESLELRRARFDLVMVYKIINGLVDIECEQFFTFKPCITRGHSRKIFVEACRIDVRKYFFARRIVHLWNSLSEDLVCSPNITIFKSKLKSYALNLSLYRL